MLELGQCQYLVQNIKGNSLQLKVKTDYSKLGYKGQIFTVSNGTTIGRKPQNPSDNHILIEKDQQLSSVHGSFLQFQSSFYYLDNSSTNGSWKRFPRDIKTILKNNTIIKLGYVEFIVHIGKRKYLFDKFIQKELCK